MKKLTILFFLFCSVGFSQQLINSYQYAVPTPSDPYTSLDAASPVSETNAIGGWVDDVGTNMDVAAVGSPTNDGSFALRFVNNGGGSAYMEVEILAEVGETYTITWAGQRESGFFWEVWLRADNGWNADQGSNIGGISTSSFTDGSLTAVANVTNPTIQIGTNSSGGNGNAMVIDNIRVVKQ